VTASCLVFFSAARTMQLGPGAMRGDEQDEDPKKPHPVSIGCKGDNAVEAQELGPSEVDPDGKRHDDRDHHMHVRC
jgi:hypothetical protein